MPADYIMTLLLYRFEMGIIGQSMSASPTQLAKD
jgi:hypothetical protein